MTGGEAEDSGKFSDVGEVTEQVVQQDFKSLSSDFKFMLSSSHGPQTPEEWTVTMQPVPLQITFKSRCDG